MRFSSLVINGVNRTGDVSQYASGKSVNAARVLRTLGKAVTCTGFVGGDTGQFLLSDLDTAEISHSFVRVDPSTRVCVTVIDRWVNTATELIEEARPLAGYAYEQLLSKFDELLPTASGVLLSGSLPSGAPIDFYSRCVASAIAANKVVVLDATGEPLRQAIRLCPTVIKPNRQELSETISMPVGTESELKAAMKQLLDKGPQWVVVTDGPGETAASDGTAFWKISTPSVAVISPIGSGDSFAAGLMAGINDGLSVPESCKLASACGAANAMTAQAGFLKKEVVEQLIKSVTLAEF